MACPFDSSWLLLFKWLRRTHTMATKAKNKGKGQVLFAPGTRHQGITPSLATLNRQPLALPVAKAQDKKEFILGLLKGAGAQGLTWAAIQASLRAEYGSAPKKRAVLYALLGGVQWHKTGGEKGVVSYYLGKDPRRKAK
jgi:hypothetical protein